MMPLIRQIFLIPLITTLLIAANSAPARSPLAVELISFTAVGISNGVELRWETATELNASAFYLERGQGGGFVTLSQLVDANGQPYPGGLIEAEGSPIVGAIYIARDLTAVPGQTYIYQLVEVESSNQSTVIATTSVLAGGAPIPTQITIGDNSTPTSAPQSTATPANTAVATTLPNALPTQTTSALTRVIITPTPAVVENQIAPEGNGTGSAAGGGAGSSAGNSQPAAPAPTESGIVEIAQIPPTPESGYPGPPTQPEAEDGYPGTVVTPLTIEITETPYPANAFLPEQQPTPTIIGVVGSQSNGSNSVVSAAGTEQGVATSSSSTAVLWLGFLGGLLIFIAAIAGSIALFVRRRQ
ncbi:MAG TPA: hypothetical protein PLD25_21770 [Chloroflexota bacterium]|nr:hypothetical protein [Chloroflexota bacterium]